MCPNLGTKQVSLGGGEGWGGGFWDYPASGFTWVRGTPGTQVYLGPKNKRAAEPCTIFGAGWVPRTQVTFDHTFMLLMPASVGLIAT